MPIDMIENLVHHRLTKGVCGRLRWGSWEAGGHARPRWLLSARGRHRLLKLLLVQESSSRLPAPWNALVADGNAGLASDVGSMAACHE